MQVRCFVRREQAVAGRTILRCAGKLARDISNTIQHAEAVADFELNFHSRLLDQVAQVHCEKWVEEIGAHSLLYSGAIGRGDRPALAHHSGRPFETLILKNKVFSGDVSGTIGEALFSLFLTREMGVNDTGFSHLRAVKWTGIAPDFIVFSRTALLDNLLGLVPTPPKYPFVAEVKTISSPIVNTIKGRIADGLAQLVQFWHLRKRRVPSILAVAVRNSALSAYDMFIIVARA